MMLWLWLLACTSGPAGTGETDVDDDSGTDTDTQTDTDTVDTAPDCALGDICNPIRVDSFPFTDSRNTMMAPRAGWEFYSCAPDVRESGGEFIYEVVVTEPGVLSLTLNEESDDGVDIDVHLLQALDPDTCVTRAHIGLSEVVDPGTWIVVADSWTDSSGIPYPGPYTLDIDFRGLPSGSCATTPTDLRMFWSSCGAGMDCYQQGGDTYLRTPATGPVVQEAHLVTEAESFAGNGFPTSASDQLARHYELSAQATGYVFNRKEPWAPAGEGGSQWGQGSSAPAPLIDEAWYVNMYWKDRPARGTRMIVKNETTGRAVVAAAGYETGPGSNTAIGGASEEIHHYLQTEHRDELTMGFAVDTSLPLGPISCF